MKAIRRFRTGVLGSLLAVALLASCGGSGVTEVTPQPPLDTTPTTTIAPKKETIWDFISTNPQYSVLASLIKEAKLDSTLGGTDKFTLFAPSDAVFNAASAATLETVRKDPRALKALVLNHVWDVETMSIDFLPGSFTVMSGKQLDSAIEGQLTIAGFPVLQPDIRMSNGVIHEIAGVILG